MSILITEVKTKQQLKQFIKFPFSLYEGNNYWVPPLIADDLKTFNPQINPAYDFCESQLFLASRNGELCGRVAVIINHRYNEKVNKKMLRFGWIDFIDDYEVSKALLIRIIVGNHSARSGGGSAAIEAETSGQKSSAVPKHH